LLPTNRPFHRHHYLPQALALALVRHCLAASEPAARGQAGEAEEAAAALEPAAAALEPAAAVVLEVELLPRVAVVVLEAEPSPRVAVVVLEAELSPRVAAVVLEEHLRRVVWRPEEPPVAEGQEEGPELQAEAAELVELRQLEQAAALAGPPQGPR
jgi:hypothetical protein